MLSSRIILAACFAAALIASTQAWAQAEQTPENLLDEPLPETPPEAEEVEEDEEESAVSRETDFSEENFRRSMELLDREQQRSPNLTTGSYSTGTGLQQLDALPEASQKHLREELREVIVQNGPWTPAEEGETYPYEPSAAAKENGSLANRERAAWRELVAKYHEREAAIHANSARSRAATTRGQEESQQAEREIAARNQGQQQGQGTSSDQASEQASNRSEAASAAASPDASAASEEQVPVIQGVSQNALELLTQRQQLPAESAQPPGETEASAESQAKSQAESQANTQTQTEYLSEGIIAIEDLDKVNLEPEEQDKD